MADGSQLSVTVPLIVAALKRSAPLIFGFCTAEINGLTVEVGTEVVWVWMVPDGLTVQDCVADAAPEAVAITVKLFAVRDCCAVGVHERVFSLSVAPVGAFDKENVTAAPLAAS